MMFGFVKYADFPQY